MTSVNQSRDVGENLGRRGRLAEYSQDHFRKRGREARKRARLNFDRPTSSFRWCNYPGHRQLRPEGMR